MRILGYVMTLLLIGGLVIPVMAQDELSFSYVGSGFWMDFKDAAIQDDYVYLVGRYGLFILDVSNPSSPQLLSHFHLPPCKQLAVSGGYAYIVANELLYIIDISNPTSPALAAYVDTPATARDVDVWGDYVYVADDEGGLYIVDVTNPPHPVEVTSVFLSHGAMRIDVYGAYAFITTAASLEIINIYDPHAPSPASSLPLTNGPVDIEVKGYHAYLAIGFSSMVNKAGLQIINISDPYNPYEEDYYNTYPEGGFSVGVSGDYAYLSVSNQGMKILDVSDPSSPVLSGIYNPAFYSYTSILAKSDTVFFTDYDMALNIVDATTPSSPQPVGNFGFPGSTYQVAKSGNYLYTARLTDGLQVLDITDPTLPELVEMQPTNGWAQSVALSGEYVLVGTRDRYLQIFNASDPSNLYQVGSVRLDDVIFDIKIQGDYAYVAANNDGLRIIDISNPSAPSLVATGTITSSAQNIFHDGSHVFVASDDLIIVDVSNPESPFVKATYATSSSVTQLSVSDQYAYITLSGVDTEFDVIDVSDPSQPYLAGSCVIPYYTKGRESSGKYVFITRSNGVMAINVANPNAPYVAGEYKTCGQPQQILHEGKQLYIAEVWGLMILSYAQRVTNYFTNGSRFEREPCHAWGFTNSADFCEPYCSDFPTKEVFMQAFGLSNPFLSPASFAYYRLIKLKFLSGWGGTCYGFAYGSQLIKDGYHNLADMSWTSATCPGDIGADDINLGCQNYINALFLQQLGYYQSTYTGFLANHGVDETVSGLYDVLNTYSSAAISIKWIQSNGKEYGHSITPLSIESDVDNPNIYYVRVYDNRYNDQDYTLTLNTESDAWTLDANSFPYETTDIYVDVPTSVNRNPAQIPIVPGGLKNPPTAGFPEDTSFAFLGVLNGNDIIITTGSGWLGHVDGNTVDSLEGGSPFYPVTDQVGFEYPPFYVLQNSDFNISLADNLVDSSEVFIFRPGMACRVKATGMVGESEINIRIDSLETGLTLLATGPEPQVCDFSAISVNDTYEWSFSGSELHLNTDDSFAVAVNDVGDGEASFLISNYGNSQTLDLSIEYYELSTTTFSSTGIELEPACAYTFSVDRDSMYTKPMVVEVDWGMDDIIDSTFMVANEFINLCGDANGDAQINVGDAVFLINYIFKSGPAPDPVCAGDANGDGSINVGDAVYLINYVFKSGPTPVEGCCQE